jgi:hypothetical protein
MNCLTYLRKTAQSGPRHFPPHFVEFAAATVCECKYFMIDLSKLRDDVFVWNYINYVCVLIETLQGCD